MYKVNFMSTFQDRLWEIWIVLD